MGEGVKNLKMVVLSFMSATFAFVTCISLCQLSLITFFDAGLQWKFSCTYFFKNIVTIWAKGNFRV